MREEPLLRHIYERSAALAGQPGILVGPGDDCALVSIGGGRLLATVDHLIESRHYAPGTPLDLVARKSIARSISDIAAMAGTPKYSLATAALPADWSQSRADELFDAMHRWASHFGAPLVGGDIAALPSTNPSHPILTVTVLGEPHARRGAVTRAGAQPGQSLYVTGAIGGSLGSGRHLHFDPRTAEAAWLADALGDRLTAMIDVSDGLGRDAGRIAAMSRVRIDLFESGIPRHADATDTYHSDGEDYELLFAAAGSVPTVCPTTGVAITRIGEVKQGAGCVLVQSDGQTRDARNLGWEHAG